MLLAGDGDEKKEDSLICRLERKKGRKREGKKARYTMKRIEKKKKENT